MPEYREKDSDAAYTPQADEASRWQTVKSYQKRGIMLEGTVTEVRPLKSSIYAVVDLEGFDVLIPDAWFITDGFFNATYDRAGADEQYRRRYQSMRACVGARICYVIKSADRNADGSPGYLVLGSRTDALRLKREHFFLRGELPPEDRIAPGKIIKCKVLTVGENGIRAEAYGVDFYINNRHLSLMHPIMDARDHFSPGDEIRALLQKLYINTDESVYLQASVRQLEHEKVKDGYRNATVGSTVSGYVSGYNAEKHSYTLVLSCGCYANCHQNSVIGGETLALGDTVSLQIKEVRTGYVTGTCMRINSLCRKRSMVYSWDS